MKKTILSFALILTGLVSQAQVKAQTNFGIVQVLGKEFSELMLVNSVGLEFGDKIGIEYGYSYSVNKNTDELYNYLYGNSTSWTAGHFNHLIAAYYKTKRNEGVNMNIGAGVSLLTEYSTNYTRTRTTPYIKLGIDKEYKKGWGTQMNVGLGNIFLYTLGITKKL